MQFKVIKAKAFLAPRKEAGMPKDMLSLFLTYKITSILPLSKYLFDISSLCLIYAAAS